MLPHPTERRRRTAARLPVARASTNSVSPMKITGFTQPGTSSLPTPSDVTHCALTGSVSRVTM